MKLFWKLFCSMVSVSILACAVGGFVLIDGQFRAALEQEMEVLRGENDMLRYALFMEAEGRVLSGREELARLSGGEVTAVMLDGAEELLSAADEFKKRAGKKR